MMIRRHIHIHLELIAIIKSYRAEFLTFLFELEENSERKSQKVKLTRIEWQHREANKSYKHNIHNNIHETS